MAPCELWIGADGANTNFFHPSLIGSVNQLSAHHQVVVEQFTWLYLIQTNTDVGC